MHHFAPQNGSLQVLIARTAIAIVEPTHAMEMLHLTGSLPDDRSVFFIRLGVR